MGGKIYLGVEGGGTRTTAVLADASGRVLESHTFGPGNLKLMSLGQLRDRLKEIARRFPKASAIGIGMAGARTGEHWAVIQTEAARLWKGVPIAATHDLELAWQSIQDRKTRACDASILLLSGTGSCVYGKSKSGELQRLGGWGHLLGDKGSGYEIGLRGLKAVVFYHDLDGRWTRLGQSLLAATQCNEPNDFIDWVQQAGKENVATLAQVVFECAAKRDPIAKDILDGAVASIARDAVRVAKKLRVSKGSVAFGFAGSVFLKQNGFRKRIEKEIASKVSKAIFIKQSQPSVMGAVRIAMELGGKPIELPKVSVEPKPWDEAHIAKSPTEMRHPGSMNLHRMSIPKAVDLFLDEDQAISRALKAEKQKISRAVRMISDAFEGGGRLFYVGAGTSGRLGVLDASECPPTFRSDPEMVQGIIAGGQRALANAVDGAEDDAAAGARAVRFRRVGSKDVVVGIAASGRTPFVWGALWEAAGRGARTVMICFNPNLHLTRTQRPDLLIAPEIGPELLTGSTRLKSGTATKLILNLFTTLAMVQHGKVIENLMVDVNPSNVKLKNRALRIVSELTGMDEDASRQALDASGWSVFKTWDRWSRSSKGRKGKRR